MQETIDNLAAWAKKWGMEYNTKKCKVLHVGKNNPKIKYYMDGIELEETKDEKDLGVWMTENLKPSKQCNSAAKNANFALGQIRRAFHYRKKEMIIPLYKTFVRPRLESSVAAWSPWYVTDMKAMEKVQERMVKMLSNVRGTYEERLTATGLTTLEERRTRGDLIETFKTLKGFNKVEKEEWFKEVGHEARPTRANTIITGGGEKRKELILQQERARLDVRKHFFTVRVVKKWNELPEEVKNQTSINGFKNSYDRWRLNQPRNGDETNDVERTNDGENG